MPRAELLDRVAGKAGRAAMLTDRVDDELLDRGGPGLRAGADYAVGHDNLDLDACTARGVLATNTPDVVTEATATWPGAAAGLGPAGRRGGPVPAGRAALDWGPEFFLGFEVHGETLGVIGLAASAGRWPGGPPGSPCRCSTRPGTSCRPPKRPTSVAWRELDDLLAEADFVTVHTGLSPATRHLIGAGQRPT